MARPLLLLANAHSAFFFISRIMGLVNRPIQYDQWRGEKPFFLNWQALKAWNPGLDAMFMRQCNIMPGLARRSI
jgi:hypothetical protein